MVKQMVLLWIEKKEFMPIYESIAKEFPNLTIIMEHITTKDAVDLLDKYENLYATVTLHHLLISFLTH